MISSRTAPFILTTLLCSGAHAASSVLVWPIFQTISSDAHGSQLWLENRGSTPVNLQLRTFAWDQKDSDDVYADQNDIIASPPFATIPPGQRQLVRVMRTSPVPSGTEKAYRIVIDEIPTPQPAPEQKKNSAGLDMRMRYVLPLFTYGRGITPLMQNDPVEPIRTTLNWSLSARNGRQMLCIKNTGNQHARLSNVYWMNGKTQIPLAQGLLGYILAQHNVCFPVASNIAATANMPLFAKLTDNSIAVEIPATR